MFSVFKRLTDNERNFLSIIERFVLKKRVKQIKKLLKQKKAELTQGRFNITITESQPFPQIKSNEYDVTDINVCIKDIVRRQLFKDFSKDAFEKISSYIAPQLTGMEHIKKAVVLQLFASEPVHILLLGDPGTGKTAVLHSAVEFSPVASFGLGSGTSGAGLVVTPKGNEIVKGLLPQADGGICAIDELNLMKKEDYAGLYNAMEKGFVTYDKGGKHYKFDARIKVLATANPKGDVFKGATVRELKKELPFDSALLTRFHLSFIIRKPDLKQFKEIASSILSGQRLKKANQEDAEFVKAYLKSLENLGSINISKENQALILNFVEELKKNENRYLTEISPRLVIGIMRLCKALARMEARTEVEKQDIERVKEIVVSSLKIK